MSTGPLPGGGLKKHQVYREHWRLKPQLNVANAYLQGRRPRLNAEDIQQRAKGGVM